jgi:putative transcriptional regulator
VNPELQVCGRPAADSPDQQDSPIRPLGVQSSTDRLHLLPIEPLQPEQIKHIRETTRVSQAVFARLLNNTPSTVQKWEIGQKKTTGTALKLRHLVQKRGIEAVA